MKTISIRINTWVLASAIGSALVIAVAWCIRVEVTMADQRATKQLAEVTSSKLNVIESRQDQSAHAIKAVEFLTQEVKALRHDVITLTVEFRNLKARLAQETRQNPRGFVGHPREKAAGPPQHTP